MAAAVVTIAFAASGACFTTTTAGGACFTTATAGGGGTGWTTTVAAAASAVGVGLKNLFGSHTAAAPPTLGGVEPSSGFTPAP